jgi:hypothetical protein
VERWDDKIANGTFRWVVYHTLFFLDLYLSPDEAGFELRELHERGGDERQPIECIGLDKADALSYVAICRQKIDDTLAAETEASLAGSSGFSWYKVSRGELHIINIRHVQHHTGQLSAHLRRVDARLADRNELRWVQTGWR